LIAAGGLIMQVAGKLFDKEEWTKKGEQLFLANAEQALTLGARGDNTVLPNYSIQRDGYVLLQC
jgi:hypothetical protein